MKKSKKEYSLTAKQRKLNRTGEPKPKTPDEMTQEERAAQLEQEQQHKTKVKKITRLTAIIVAVIVAFGSITAGTVLLVRANAIDNTKVNPTATITLNVDGETKKLEMELYYKDAPAAVSNFIYLALSGFYDDTIFNATSSDQRFLAMSGFKTPDTHKGKDTTVISNLKGFSTHTNVNWGTNLYKLSYRLKRVQTSVTSASPRGHIAFLGGSTSTTAAFATSTTFMIMGENPNLKAGTSNTDLTNMLTYIGKLNAESMLIVDDIIAIDPADVVECLSDSKWSYANPDTKPITIKSISISKLNRKLRNNITNNFEKYVLTEENVLGWATNTYAKTDGYYKGN